MNDEQESGEMRIRRRDWMDGWTKIKAGRPEVIRLTPTAGMR